MATVLVKRSVDIADYWYFQVTGNPRVININFQFEGKDDYRDNMKLTLSFHAYSLKIDTPESIIVLFSPQKLVRLFPLKDAKPSPDR